MENLKFDIITLSGSQLIRKYNIIENELNEISYEIDFNNPKDLRFFLKNTGEYKDNALFFQIRQIVKGQTEWDINSLKKYILFIDFERIFSEFDEFNKKEMTHSYSVDELDPKADKVTKEYKVYQLFKTGIKITFRDTDGRKEIIKFVPFDKSSSMSRQSKISFINENIIKELNERLNLGMAFNKQKVNLSKFYAYRGLYLSDAVRADLLMDSEKVIIINDVCTEVEQQKFITAVPDKKSNNKWKLQINENEFRINEVYDGEGLISFEYAEKINEICGFSGATSFQIRMPFAKGMLHKVDFHNLIRELLTGKGIPSDTCYIKDYFGADKDLMKAEIIMPTSMFKCKAWLKKDVENSRLIAEDKKKCPNIFMDHYFEMFHKYNHALYISNTNLTYKKSGFTRLNYQFLNTLDLKNDEFDILVKKHYYFATNPLEYVKIIDNTSMADDFDELDQQFMSPDEMLNDEEQEIETEEDENLQETGIDDKPGDSNLEVWKQAVLKNPLLAHEGKITEKLRMISEGLLLDGARGKLITRGEIRFLSRDLLKFILDLIKPIFNDFSSVEKECLYENSFYLPQNVMYLKKHCYYPLFRNPHLSRNEQCALLPYVKPYEDDKNYYTRYFSHLSGIIMVAYNSLAPFILGGADFDGDTVKIITDKRIRKAVLRGTYDYNGNENIDSHKEYKRRLPAIKIPSPDSSYSQEVSDTPDYLVIRNTFSNRIGKISNLSIRLGADEYGSVPSNLLLENTCEACTIYTGLEIDAAKTGAHPDLTDIMEFSKSGINLLFDYLSKFKNKIDLFMKQGNYLYDKLIEKEERTSDDITYIMKKKKDDQKPYIEYHYVDGMRSIDKLPRYFFDWIHENHKVVEPEPDEKVNGRYPYFAFDEKNIGKTNKEVLNKMSTVMVAYYRLIGLSKKLNRFRKNLEESDYIGRINTLINMQYDEELREDVIADLEDFRTYIENKLPSFDSIQNAIDVLKGKYWAFQEDEFLKKDVLNLIFKPEGDDIIRDIKNVVPISNPNNIIRFIENYDAQGYNMLYYLLKDTSALMSGNMTDNEIIDKEIEKEDTNDLEIDTAAEDAFYHELKECFLEWKLNRKEKWKKAALLKCMQAISNILKENKITDRKDIIYAFYLLKGKKNGDKDGDFFWGILNNDDVDKFVLKKVKKNA